MSRSPVAPSYFTLPVTTTRDSLTPSRRNRPAYSSVCTANAVTWRNSSRLSSDLTRIMRPNVRGLMRAFATTTGMRRSPAAARKFGHNSLSASTTMAGFTRSSASPHAQLKSNGYAMTLRSGNFTRASASPVSVVLLTTTRQSG